MSAPRLERTWEEIRMTNISRRTLLISAGALAASATLGGKAFAQSDVAANLTVSGFGNDAELGAITNAIARFNQTYPNVKVDVTMDTISNGWGDYVTKVLGQFNSGTAMDVYGTAIETFQALGSRDIFLPLDDLAKAPEFADISPSLFKQASYKGHVLYIPIGWNNIMFNYNRDLF